MPEASSTKANRVLSAFAFFRLEFQRDAVDAIPQARWVWPIGEDMAQMSLAAGAMHFGPAHEQAAIFALAHHFGIHRLIKRWPASAAFELMRLIK